MTDVIGDALGRYALECAAHGHALCSHTQTCVGALAEYEAREKRDGEAPTVFDAQQMWLQRSDEWPDETWPTAALLWLVKAGVLQPPHRDPLRRTMQVTTALARLGERGLPPDAIIRTCLGPALVRRILIEAGTVWVLVREGKVPRDRLPMLDAWLAELDAEPEIAGLANPTVSDVISAALQGRPAQTARLWLDRAAIAHVLGWRLDNYQATEVHEDDRMLAAGIGATIWVVDRFTETYLQHWSRPSLDWELVYLYDPSGTADRIGLPTAMLDERRVPADHVVGALSRRLSGADADDPAVGQLRAAEVVEAIVERLRRGDLGAALDQAEVAARGAPDNPYLVNALAFCLIPHEPKRAHNLLERTTSSPDARARAVSAINRATLDLFAGDHAAAMRSLADVPDWTDDHVWCWAPREAIGGSAHLTSMSFAAWRSEVLKLAPVTD